MYFEDHAGLFSGLKSVCKFGDSLPKNINQQVFPEEGLYHTKFLPAADVLSRWSRLKLARVPNYN